VKGKCPLRAIKACGGSRGVAPFVLTLGIRWRSLVSPPPQLPYPSYCPHNRRLGGRFGEEKTLAPAANRMSDGAVTVPTELPLLTVCGRDGD